MDNKEKFVNLRNEYKNFYFERFISIENDFCIEVIYFYSIDKKIDFRHKIRIRKNHNFKKNIDMNKILVNIGIIEGINYYKSCCTKNYHIECDEISEEQNKWWKKLFYRGLSELIYLNEIETTEDEFVNFIGKGKKVNKCISSNYKGNLILVGGGKDSNTSLEILSNSYEYNDVLIMNPRNASIESARIAEYDNPIVIERELDEKIFSYNKDKYLNGHVPFSAILSFVALAVAEITGKKYIIASNEMSANENTVGIANHQYSKSFDYEKDFRNYVSKYIYEGKGVEYYSLLRPLYELQIVKIFSRYPKYFDTFKSCNVGSKIKDKREVWCCNCPKCLFVYILMLAFNDEKVVTRIFGENMLNKIEMKNDFDKLIGKHKEKPFECVGTKKEVNAALSLIIKRYKDFELIKYYINECKEYILDDNEINSILYNYNEENFIQNDQKIIIKELLGM